MAFTSDYKFHGKHAEYVHFLTKLLNQNRDDGINLFQRVVDVYMIAPIFGLMYNRFSNIDYSSNTSSTISFSTINNERDRLEYIYRLIIMCDVRVNRTNKEAVDQAFKYDDDKEQLAINDATFNGYVLGGVEYLYEYFKDTLDDEELKFNRILELINELDPNFEIDYDI